MTDKNSFVLYLDAWDVIEELDTEQRGVLFTAIYAVQLGLDLPEMDKETRIVFKGIKNTLIRDKTKYEKIIESRSKAGKLGAEKRWCAKNGKTVENSTNEWQTIANIADSVSVSVSDSVSVSVSESEAEGGQNDDDTTDLSFDLYGTLKNVKLTPEQHRKIVDTYQTPSKLINKVSSWLPTAERPPADHFALVHRFAVNDDWPKKPKPDPPPEPLDPERGELCSMPDEVQEKINKLFS